MSSKNLAKKSAKKNWESIFETQVWKIYVKIAAPSKPLNIFTLQARIISITILQCSTKNMVDASYWFCITQKWRVNRKHNFEIFFLINL